MSELAPALRARGGQLALVLEEVALGVTARQAEGDPVPERLPTLLLDPVAFRLRHYEATVEAAAGAFVRVRSTLARRRETTHGRT